MAAFYFNTGNKTPMMAIPETRVYMDGHPILTHSYSIYKNTKAVDSETMLSEDEQKKQSNPNYAGFITFEIPGRVFNYTDDGPQTLSRQEVEEVVEQISHYRDNPEMWKHLR